VNISENVKRDEKFQEEIFKNELFESLVQLMNFSVSVKSHYNYNTSNKNNKN